MDAARVFIVDKPATQIESNGANDADAPGILERLIRQAETSGASDIHLQMRGSSAEVSFRLDGVINRVSELPEKIAPLVFGRIKFLARLKTYQESLPQDGRIDKADAGSQNDIRVATYPTVTGEKIVLRLFNSSSAKSIRELGMAAEICKALETFLRQTNGMMLLTGPAGSGKTTTIYACLRELATTGGRQIITVEDPVEQIVPGVMQTEVNEALGLDFAKAARHLLRQDPQALVIGEIRDEETANIAVRAALTGHLVISTLHAGSCRGVFERLLVLCKDHAAVASSLELVLNQRLARTLCASCAGKGCGECLNTGYHGRAPMVEWWRMDETVRRQIVLGDTTGIRPQHTHLESARALLREELTNRAEVSRVLGIDVAEIDTTPSP